MCWILSLFFSRWSCFVSFLCGSLINDFSPVCYDSSLTHLHSTCSSAQVFQMINHFSQHIYSPVQAYCCFPVHLAVVLFGLCSRGYVRCLRPWQLICFYYWSSIVNSSFSCLSVFDSGKLFFSIWFYFSDNWKRESFCSAEGKSKVIKTV